MATIRVKNGVQATVFNSATKSFETLVPGRAYDTSDPFVKEFAWVFQSDADADVEQASAAPGEKRNAGSGR